MINELDLDIRTGRIYLSPRLTEEGSQAWVELLREAFRLHNDIWLASILQNRSLMVTTEQRRKPKGGFTTARVPFNAHETLAEGEFNRFYARGLCACVLAEGGSEVEVYRGKIVTSPRPESEAMIGQHLSAQQLLEDLRTAQGVEPALGLPPGPNSGLTVRRIERS